MEARTGSAMVEFVFEPPDPSPDYWVVLGDRAGAQLSAGCREPIGAGQWLLRAEAINARDGTRDQREDRVALLWGLRKRTIQILVRLSLQGLLFIPRDGWAMAFSFWLSAFGFWLLAFGF